MKVFCNVCGKYICDPENKLNIYALILEHAKSNHTKYIADCENCIRKKDVENERKTNKE